MGQYQQWLFAQEIDRRLKMEIETLETELLYLQDRIAILEQTVPETENTILQALLAYLHSQEQSASLQAQADWHELPRPKTPPAQLEETTPSIHDSYARSEMAGDMLAFFDKRGQADPQLSLWLQNEHKRAIRAGDGEHVLVDEETRRLNESIRRWFERWHRRVASITQAEELTSEQ
ncbi:MAG TPA: hypothetical protein VKV19_05525 [Ktedonobacteraceae bacterium]|nr:hypothetical protein [Ktedonobacteraceae bacterium]